MFEYAQTFPVDFTETSAVIKDGCTIKDGSYMSPYGGNVPAYLIVPHKNGPFPAVIYMHPGQGSRTTFIAEAEFLASKGIASLLLDAPFLRRAVPQELSAEQRAANLLEVITDIQLFKQTIVDIQRGIDLLTCLDYIDPNRLAYVGHSFGATWGGVLAGVEKRVKAYALIAGYSRSSEWHRTSNHPLATFIRHSLSTEQFHNLVVELEQLDGIHYIKNASPASVLFQFARNDEFVSQKQADEFYAAACPPKEMIWYETDHLFTKGTCAAAYQDRTNWIINHIS